MTGNSHKPVAGHRDQNRPRSSNHVIWGMIAGLLIGTAIDYLALDRVAIGVGIGIVIGAILAAVLSRFVR